MDQVEYDRKYDADIGWIAVIELDNPIIFSRFVFNGVGILDRFMSHLDLLLGVHFHDGLKKCLHTGCLSGFFQQTELVSKGVRT